MRYTSRLGVVFIVVFLCWSVQVGFCQQDRQRSLMNVENLTLDSTAQRVYYEQRLYRNPVIGLLELSQALSLPSATEFVPLYQGIPIAGYQPGNNWQTRLLSRSDRKALGKLIPAGPGHYKLDFRIQPEVIANFGFKMDPFQTKTSLLLQTQLYLSRGLVLNAGVLFPITNNYDNQPMNIRPAPIYLNQFLALDEQNFLSGSVGLFYSNQYGVNLQYRRANLTKPWSFGLEASLTGDYYFPTRGIYYESMNKAMVLADVAYRFRKHDITLKLSGGQYLYQDRGVRLDFIRQIYSVEVGIFAMKTSKASTAGFNFAIPIPPGRLAQSKRFRLRTTEEFRWEYSYNGGGNNVGLRYRLGNQLDALLRQYHSDYLRQQVP
ncbi:YjbH domain-containing protein [Spirosoma validum]|uniref:YjbH domain-containing protein n=1 Tax=Spirosoma validum TaxID=2771355 RepID=A0A927GD31_9BACT|nr:YjbH domain-containing protein [Spirosoma validum]MBD2753294.1 YjbH domain-containing protein [Spirosoma validum]